MNHRLTNYSDGSVCLLTGEIMSALKSNNINFTPVRTTDSHSYSPSIKIDADLANPGNIDTY